MKLKRTNSKSEEYIELRKGESIITHTLERIRIPLDCAGKIEIRSTYARLSLSVTTGDYCNPGYHGYYPLVLRNDGKHTIRIHPREPMLQLMIVSLCGIVIKDYPTRASFANAKGIDEGNPYDFYRTDIVKRMRKVIGYEDILEIYHATLSAINANNTDDPAQTKERFTDVFLSYCSARLQKKKYRKETSTCDHQYDTYELWKDFTQREKRIKSLFSLKTKLASAFIPAAAWVIPILIDNNITLIAILPWGIPITILYIAIIVILLCIDPKVYCTCERIDYDKLKSPSPQP